MRATTTAVLFSLLLTSCAGRGPTQTDAYGALLCAVILGAGVAIFAHND